jgi:hypothetical protein
VREPILRLDPQAKLRHGSRSARHHVGFWSTEATPSTISPSAGMNSPRGDEDDVTAAERRRWDDFVCCVELQTPGLFRVSRAPWVLGAAVLLDATLHAP